MKALALLVICILCAGPAFAIIDDDINSLGAYFDSSGDVYCFAPTPATPFNVYWILAHPVAANLGGYEFAWAYSPEIVPAPFVLGTVLPPGALNLGSGYNLIVSLNSGLVTSDATVLATVNLMVLTWIPYGTYIAAGPATPASIPGHAATRDFADPSDIVPMTFNFANDGWIVINDQGWTVPGVARFFTPCDPIVLETARWGSIKALFR